MASIRFTVHARLKFADLATLGLGVSEAEVLDVLAAPDETVPGHHNRKVAQKGYGPRHVLRVVFEEHENEIVVVTFYPARRRRYEGQV